MGQIKDYIDVDISIASTANIKSEEFDLLLVLGTNKVFTERYREYTDANSLLSDGFREDSAEYQIASAIFQFNPAVPRIYIGRRQADSVTLKVDTVLANTNYTIRVNSTTYTFNSGSTPTAITIAAGLVAAMSADTVVNVTDHEDGTYTITAKVADTAYTVNIDARQSFHTLTSSETIVESIEAISLVVNDWFAIMETSRTKSDVLSLATWCNNAKKLFITASSESDIINSSVETTTVAAVFRIAKYAFATCMYHANLSEWIEAAWFGACLSIDPGKETWAKKQLLGITPDNLTQVQSATARAKRCNTFEKVGGVNITTEGYVCDDKYIYIDLVRDIEYLKNDIQVNLFGLTVENNKIPYDDGGITSIEGELKKRLGNSVGMGILAPDPKPITSVPLSKDASQADKQNRILNNVKFSGETAGAIHKVVIRGTLTY